MAALRHRNFRLLFAGRAISFFGTNVVPVALAFAVLDLGSASDLGLVLAAGRSRRSPPCSPAASSATACRASSS